LGLSVAFGPLQYDGAALAYYIKPGGASGTCIGQALWCGHPWPISYNDAHEDPLNQEVVAGCQWAGTRTALLTKSGSTAAQRTTGVELHRFVLKYGRAFVDPSWSPLLAAQSQQCFQNASTAISHEDWNYAEGFVWSETVPILVEHA
jgi:hypothetical protein